MALSQETSMLLFIVLVYGSIALIIFLFIMLFRSVRRIEKAVTDIKNKVDKMG